MTTEKITIFHTNNKSSSSNKVPFSPYNDKTFVFETVELKSSIEMFRLMVSHFILNIPLHKQEAPIRTFRRKVNLLPMYGESVSYIILDIDDVHTESAKNVILEYFKDYRVILGKSKSFNGIDNFRLKGILFTESIKINDTKNALSVIAHDL